MKRFFWIFSLVIVGLLGGGARIARAQCGTCPADQQGPVTATLTVNVAAGETCEFTARGTAADAIGAFVGANVNVPGKASDSAQDDDGCFEACGGNITCIFNCQDNCTIFTVEAEATVSATFESSGIYTATASATGRCNPELQLSASCDGGDDNNICMMPVDGDMNDIGAWQEVGDISWAVSSGDGYAVIPRDDWIQQVIPMTYTTQTYWNYYAEPAAGYEGDEIQIQVTHYGLTTTPYSVTVELPASGFITIPLTRSVGIALTGVSSPTHLSYFCMGYGDECQFPDSGLTNYNWEWSPPEYFGNLAGTYESFGGAWLDPGEYFYQGQANDYTTRGNYGFTLNGAVSSTNPITLGVKLQSCGLGSNASYEEFVVTPVSGTWWITDAVVCDGNNRLEVKNLSDEEVFVDDVCLTDLATCVPAGECHLENYDFSANATGAPWGFSEYARFAPADDDDPEPRAVLSPTGHISQATCLGPGSYTIEIYAAAITDTGGFGALWIPPGAGVGDSTVNMRVSLGLFNYERSVPLDGEIYRFTIYTHLSSAVGWHDFVIEHFGSENALVIYEVCISVDETIELIDEPCGYIHNAHFAPTEDGGAAPWVPIDSGGFFGLGSRSPEFGEGYVQLPLGTAVEQALDTPEHGSHCCGYVSYNNPFDCGQCVWWAAARRADLRMNYEFYAHAREWYTAAVNAGYPITTTPDEGSVAVYQAGTGGAGSYGHVAFVEDAAGSSFDVTEMNWGSSCVTARSDTTESGIDFVPPPPGDVLTYTLSVEMRSQEHTRLQWSIWMDNADDAAVVENDEITWWRWRVRHYTFTLPVGYEPTNVRLENIYRGDRTGAEIEIAHVCLYIGDVPPWTAPMTDGRPVPPGSTITGTGDCDACDFPQPAGCDDSLGTGDCEYYGRPPDVGVGTLISNLGEYLGRWFRWIMCHLACWFRILIRAIQEAWSDTWQTVIDWDIPILSEIACILLDIPRLIQNGVNEFIVDGIINPLADSEIGQAIRERLRGLDYWRLEMINLFNGYIQPWIDFFWGALLHVGDLGNALFDLILLGITLPLQIVFLVFGIVFLIFDVIMNPGDYASYASILPGESSLFWCVLDILEEDVLNSPLVVVPSLYLAKLLWDNIRWTVRATTGGPDVTDGGGDAEASTATPSSAS